MENSDPVSYVQLHSFSIKSTSTDTDVFETLEGKVQLVSVLECSLQKKWIPIQCMQT